MKNFKSVFYRQPLPLLLLPLLLFTSCFQHKTQNTSDTVSLSDSVKFIKIADATVIDPSWKSDNAIIYQVVAEPDNLHPTNGISAMRVELNYYIHKTLMQTDYQTLKTIPCLVKAMPVVSADYTRYTYELRDEPKWDNGEQLSVDDIIFTCKANKCPLTNNPNGKPYWDNVAEIVVDSLNKRKFTVVMKRAYIQNVTMWSDYPVMQRSFYDKNNSLKFFHLIEVEYLDKVALSDIKKWATDFNSLNCRAPENIDGLGAYKVTSWGEGQSITLEKKKNHWSENSQSLYEKALPEKIIFKIIKDPTAQILEFKAGNLDASTTMSNKPLIELQQDSSFNKNYNSAFVSTFNYTYAAFNCKPDGNAHKKLFTDKNVRRAIALLTPVDQINQVLNKGKNKRIPGPVSPLKEEFNKDLKLLPLDSKQAAELLDNAGWKDSDNDGVRDKNVDGQKTDFKFDLLYFTNSPDWKDYADMMAAEYKKAGIAATPVGIDPGSAQQKMFGHDFDMIIGSWGGSSSPEDYTQLWATSEWQSNGANFVGFGNTQSDALIDSIKVAMEDEKRIKLSKQLQQIIYDEQPYVFFTAGLRRVVVHKRFGNCEFYFERPNVLLNNLKLLTQPIQ
ncbi:MAG: ABC transporter substrate-binding protein [Bacteroidia bacterium]